MVLEFAACPSLMLKWESWYDYGLRMFEYMRNNVKDDCDTLEACYLTPQGDINIVINVVRVDKEVLKIRVREIESLSSDLKTVELSQFITDSVIIIQTFI